MFSCGELLFYGAVTRLYCGVRWRDGISQDGGDGWWMVMEQGVGMGKAINRLCWHGYMLVLVWGELEVVPVADGSPLQSGGGER